MDALLVVGTGVAGLLAGGALDPAGQRLAEHSRLADVRRAAELDEAEPGRAPSGSGPPGDGGDLTSGPSHRWAEAEADDRDDPVPSDPGVADLLPSGPSAGRTLGAALATGALFAGTAAHFGADLLVAPFCVLFALLVAVSVTDLSHRLVPRTLLYPALALIAPLLVATALVDAERGSLEGAVIAGAAAFCLFFAVWWFQPGGMGFGDVRLAGVVGLAVGYLSLVHAYLAFLCGFVAGALFGVALMVGRSSGRKTRIPFAPALSLGAVIAVFWGTPLAHGLFHARG